MKVHSLLKSLNAIDEEMIAEADRFAVKRREQLKSRQHIFVTEVTAVAAIAIAVAGVFFFSLQLGHTPQKQSGQNGVLLDDTQTKTTAKADEEMKTTAEETQELVKIALAPAVYTPVSYTHLDVYKRQYRDCIRGHSCGGCCLCDCIISGGKR